MTEPTPRPDDVPEEVMRAFISGASDSPPVVKAHSPQWVRNGLARALAAYDAFVLPAHEQQVRKQVAAEHQDGLRDRLRAALDADPHFTPAEVVDTVMRVLAERADRAAEPLRLPDAAMPIARTLAEPRPADVPDELLDLAMAAELAKREAHQPERQDLARFRAENPATAAMHETAMRYLLAAVLPAHERQVRERVAAEILAERAEREQRTPDGRQIGPPATAEHVLILRERRKQAATDARIAREGRQGLREDR